MTLVMVETVRDHFLATGKKIGVKPAGGLRTAKQALQFLVMVKETVGEDWLTPELFRFGASSLLSDVELQLAKLVDGNYQSAKYFSKG
jgi:deoxyribose-phosphate aldolase